VWQGKGLYKRILFVIEVDGLDRCFRRVRDVYCAGGMVTVYEWNSALHIMSCQKLAELTQLSRKRPVMVHALEKTSPGQHSYT
jgi:hypothetical protein